MQLSDKKQVEGVKCKQVPISAISTHEYTTIPEMKNLMKKNHGIGLAAPQVGIKRTFFIMPYAGKIISCYNPSWTARTDKKSASDEGCLTYKPVWIHQVSVSRYKFINTEFTNSERVPVKIKMRGIDARVFQHETDHLKGKTIFFDPESEEVVNERSI